MLEYKIQIIEIIRDTLEADRKNNIPDKKMSDCLY